MSKGLKILLTFASAALLGGVNVAQTPPANQGSLPQLPKPHQLLLEVDLRLDSGTASTNNRDLTLDFTALEKGDGNVTIQNDTAKITHYRALEDSTPETLSQQAWIPITRRPPLFNLAERDKQGQRYGERRLVFQVKTATLTSNVVSDSIVLDPVLKEYRVSPTGTTHPLIQYAADQGFTFPRDFYDGCKGGNCTSQASENIANGSANIALQGLILEKPGSLLGPVGMPGVALAASEPASCVTKANYLLFEGRRPNPFWRIKSVAVPGANVVFHGANRFRVKFSYENKSGVCSQTTLAVGEVVVEGPERDDFIEQANPWKNAFVRKELTSPLIGPTNPRPH
jgi:hypothetical protein